MGKLKTIWAAAGLVLAAAPVCAADRGFMVTDFDRIQVEGPYTVIVEQGRNTSAKASGKTSALDSVDVTVLGKSLSIRPKRSSWGERGKTVHEAATIRISTPHLRQASLSGAGSLSIKGMKNLRVDLYLNGTGSLSATAVSADRLVVTLRGAGQAVIAGTTGNLVADVSGASGLDANALKTMDAQLTAQTSGNVSLAVVRAAKIIATGSGTVNVAGRPACEINNVGSGSVFCGETLERTP